MEIRVKNMVCKHCVEALRQAIIEAGLTPVDVELGYASIQENPDGDEMATLDKLLEQQGFSRIMDQETSVSDAVKRVVMEHVRNPEECNLNLSACIESHLHIPYDTVSRIFSAHEGRTIEKYQIAQRIEWVKELLSYGELTVSEIAHVTGYSSTAHLSRQFKSVTGMTPTQYVQGRMDRKGLNEI